MKNRISLTNRFKEIVIEIPLIEALWLNTSYSTRGRIDDRKCITLVQFISVSNTSILRTLNKMEKVEIMKLREEIIKASDSRRAIKVIEIIDNYFTR